MRRAFGRPCAYARWQACLSMPQLADDLPDGMPLPIDPDTLLSIDRTASAYIGDSHSASITFGRAQDIHAGTRWSFVLDPILPTSSVR